MGRARQGWPGQNWEEQGRADRFRRKEGHGGGGAARAQQERTQTMFSFIRPTPGKAILSYTPAHSFARTHARNAPGTESEMDFPI